MDTINTQAFRMNLTANNYTRTFNKCLLFVVVFIAIFCPVKSIAQTGTCPQLGGLGALQFNTTNCGGDNVIIEITAISGVWTAADLIQVRVEWADGSPLELFTLNNSVADPFRWTVNISHVYVDNGPQCVYDAVAILEVNGVSCAPLGTTHVEELTILVFDELDNNNIGTHDIDHDPTSTGVVNGNEIEVCEGDTEPIRVLDASDFNCTDPALIDPTGTDNRNRRERWVQFVYGTNSTITGGDVSINGTPVNAAALPFYGPVSYIGDDPATLIQEVSLNIQMPADAMAGEIFEVTLRSWNVCNPYDDNVGDGDPLNPVGGVFDPQVDASFPPQPNAIEAPVEVTQIIEVIEVAPPAIALPDIICNGTDLNTVDFRVAIPGPNTEVNWYDSDPTLGGATELTNPIGDNSQLFPATSFPAPGIDNTVAGVYSLWATYVIAGINDCESEPVQVDITIRPALPQPGNIIGADEVCADDVGVNYQLLLPAELNAEYVWNLVGTGPGTTAIQGAAPFTGQNITIDFNETGIFTSRTLTLEVFQRFTDQAPACNTPVTTLEIDVSGGPQATVTGGGNVCSGNPASDIVWTFISDFNPPFDLTYEVEDLVAMTTSIVTVPVHPNSSFTIVDPAPLVQTRFRLISLTDEVGCTTIDPSAAPTGLLGGDVIVNVTTDDIPMLENPLVSPLPPTCDVGLTTTLPGINIDLTENSVRTYEIQYTVDGNLPPSTVILTSDINGIITFTPDYAADLASTPGTYEFEITLIRDVASQCSANNLMESTFITVNPAPNPPTNPRGNTVCENDLGSALVQVDNPGPGLAVDWYDNLGVFQSTGVNFSPNATGDFFAETRNIGTGCISATRVMATVTEDQLPTAADGDLDDDITQIQGCDDFVIMEAVPVDRGGRGTWSTENVLYAEHFTNLPVGTLPDGTMEDFDFFDWSIDTTAGNLSLANDYFEVRNERMETRDSNGEMVFTTSSFDVSALTQFTVSMDVNQTGVLEAVAPGQDFISLNVQLDLGPEQLVGAQLDGNFGTQQISGIVNTGGATTARLVVRLQTDDQNEIINFDNLVAVADPDGIMISDVNDPDATVSGLPQSTTMSTVSTFFWNASSALGACIISSDPIDVTRFRFPIALDPAPVLCADDEITGEVTINDFSTTFDAAVGAGNTTNVTIEYFLDPTRTIPVNVPQNVSDGQVIYTRVTDEPMPTSFGCVSDSIITFTINPLPIAVDTTVVLCEDTFIGGVHSDTASGQNLQALEVRVTDGVAGVNVDWFENYDPPTRTFSNPILPGVAVGQEENYTATNTSIFARIESGLGCINVAEVEFIVNRSPDDNLIRDPDGVAQPNGSLLRFCIGDEFRVFRVNSNPGSSYQWTVPPEFDFNLISQTTRDTTFFVALDFNTVVPDPGVPLRMFETSADGCTGNLSEIFIAVDNIPGAPMVDGPNEVCANDQGVVFEIDPATINPFATYNWTIDAALGTLIQNNNTNIVVNIGNIPTLGTPFNVAVTESIGNNCEGAASLLQVEVIELPDISPVDIRICSNEPTNITFMDSGISSTPGDTYNITSVAVDFGLVASISNNITVPTNGVAANILENDFFENTQGAALSVVYTVVPVSAELCEGTPRVIRVSIDPEPILASNLDQTRCSGEAFGGTLSVAPGSAPAGSFNIISINEGGLTRDPGNLAQGAFPKSNVAFDFLINERFTNTTGAAVDVLYEVAPVGTTGGQCIGDPPITISFKVLPEPVGNNFTFPAVCSGVSFDFDLQPLIQNTLTSTFSWSANYGTNITGGLNSGTGNITENLTNTSSATRTVVYTVVPTSFSGAEDCVGESFEVRVPVLPSPVANDQNIDVCSIVVGGSLARFDLNTPSLLTAINPSGATITWFENAALTSPIADPANHIVDDAFPFAFAEVDDGSCQDVAQVTFNVNPTPSVTASVTQGLDCPGSSNAAITAQADFGTAPYRFNIDGGAFDVDNVFEDLPAGSFTIRALDFAGCTSPPFVVDIIPPPALTAMVESAITYVGGFDISCSGEDDGRIRVTPSGGTEPYNFVITSGPTINNTGAVTGLFFNLTAGEYDITVFDDNGCDFPVSIELFEPGPLTANSIIVSPVSCNGEADGSIRVENLSGGTGIGTYTFLLEEDRNNDTGETTGIFTGLRTGSYTVRVTDLNNCTFVTTPAVPVPEPDLLDLTIDVTSSFGSLNQEISCIDEDDGQVTVTSISGGTAPYTYTIRNSDGDSLTSNTDGVFDENDFTTHPTITGLTAGTYSVSVVDFNGCDATSFPVRIDPPFELNAGFISGDQNVCVGEDPVAFGELTAVLGGIGDYRYQWQISDVSPTAGFVDVAGATGITYTPPPFGATVDPVLPDVFYFRRLVSSGNPAGALCDRVPSNVITVNVNPSPFDVQVRAPQTVCQGDPFSFEIIIQGGSGPYRFDYQDDQGNNFVDVFGADTTLIFIPEDEFVQNTTYTVTRVQDVNTCEFFPVGATATVNVLQLDADFSIIGPSDGCSPTTIVFEFNQITGVNYEWNWFDGTPNTIINAQFDNPAMRIEHTFVNSTPTTTFNFGVTLEATDTLQSSVGTQSLFICNAQTTENVTIYPTVIANVTTQDTPVCSGDLISFTNLTQGANNHRWFYREKDNLGQELDVQTVRNPTFNIVNTGPNNPQVYEVVYQGTTNNGGGNICEAFQITEVEVYKEIIPDFTFNPTDPIFFGGGAAVTFTNTSIPNDDPTNFEYNWNFDDGLTLQDTPDPGTINYALPGLKTVTLDIVNKQAPGVCDVSITQSFTINDLPIIPDFEVVPTRGCIPTTITITNLTTGSANEFTWQIFDDNNITVFESVQLAEADTSGLPSIELDLFNEGIYTVSLTARNTVTNQRETLIQDEIVVIFPTPIASFDIRPDVVFIPDQPLRTFNFSDGEVGLEFFWDFGDGGTSIDIEPEHLYTIEGEYDISLVAFKDNGDGVICSDTLVRQISVREGGSTRIPNAFTPNTGGPSGDGRIRNEVDNDIFLPITSGVAEFNMLIFDRWGNLLFESNDRNVGWDGYDANGNLLPAGVYVFRLTLLLSNGERSSRIGDVTLIR